MTDVDPATWCAGVFSAFGIASARGRKRNPSLLVTGDQFLCESMLEHSKVGNIDAGIRWKWVCDEPEQVQAFYQLVRPHVSPTRRVLIERAWTAYRLECQTRVGSDPGPLDPADAEAERAQIEQELAALRREALGPAADAGE